MIHNFSLSISQKSNELKNKLSKSLEHQINETSINFISNFYEKGILINIKNKCINQTINSTFNKIFTKIIDLKYSSLNYLENGTNFLEQTLNSIDSLKSLVLENMQNDIKLTLQNIINSNLDNFIEKSLNLFNEYKNIFEKNINENSFKNEIVKNVLISFPLQNFLFKIMETFYKNQTYFINNKIKAPLINEIEMNLNLTKIVLNNNINSINTQISLNLDKIKEQIKENLKTFENNLNSLQLFSQNQINDFSTSFENVENLYQIILSNFTSKLDKFTKIFYEIKNNITNSIKTNLKSIDNIDKKVSDKINGSTYYNLVNTNNTINNLLNNINNYVRNNIDNLYNYIINIIYKRNLLTTKDSKQNELRTLQTIDIKEITNTINDFTNKLNTIKTLFTQTTSTLKNSVSNFDIKLSNELTQIKHPINKLLNTINFIIDFDYFSEINEFLSEKVDSIITIVNSNIKQVKTFTNDIIFFSSDYSFQLVNNLNSLIKEKVPNIYKQILITILKRIITQNKKITKDFPPKILFKVTIVLYGVPLTFEINLTYGYFFKFSLSINESDITIVIDNNAGGYASINAKAYLNLYISEVGGYIKGLLGEGIVGIKPIFRLYDFKTDLIGYVQLKAFAFSFGVYTKIPWITFKKKCFKIFKKICIKIPIIKMKTLLLGVDIYKGLQKNKSWNLLF